MSFVNERTIKSTRKRHICAACDKWIEAGETAIGWAGVTDGDFHSCHYHPECREAEVGYNMTCLNIMFNDDWTPLHEAEREDYPWIHAEHPVAYRRMIMTRDQCAANPHPPKPEEMHDE